jgi:nitrite reductase/ring-hydroxylating ferredoxin subunit
MKNFINTTKQTKGLSTRRSFIRRMWGLAGAIAGLELLWAGSGFLRAGKSMESDARKRLVTAGKVADFRPGDVFPFRNGQFYLVRYSNGGFLAVSLKCSHLGCSVIWDESKQSFNCPCHASSFDKQGMVVNPPAPRPLDVYPVVIEGGMVKVDTHQPMKRKAFDPSQITFA